MALTKDYGLGEYTFPRGWFMVAEASELKDKVLPVRFFGQEFALYRGKSGKVVLLDAFCPHMGTNMARNESSYVVRDGQIEGDSIRCPYHAWRFGPDGKCNDIPYSKAPIPKAACVRSWPVVESLGAIFVWHDAGGRGAGVGGPVAEGMGRPAVDPLEVRPPGHAQLPRPGGHRQHRRLLAPKSGARLGGEVLPQRVQRPPGHAAAGRRPPHARDPGRREPDPHHRHHLPRPGLPAVQDDGHGRVDHLHRPHHGR